jgi:hypothetical protein
MKLCFHFEKDGPLQGWMYLPVACGVKETAMIDMTGQYEPDTVVRERGPKIECYNHINDFFEQHSGEPMVLLDVTRTNALLANAVFTEDTWLCLGSSGGGWNYGHHGAVTKVPKSAVKIKLPFEMQIHGQLAMAYVFGYLNLGA